MSREFWKPSNMLYPVPAVIVTCRDEEGHDNMMTAAWAGTICSDPVMVSVSIRKERYSHDIIERTGEFVLCLTTGQMARATDYVGVRSGRNEDKFQTTGLHKTQSQNVAAPGIAESPVCLECKVEQILRLGSHDMFVARVLSTDIDTQYLDEKGRFDLDRADLIAYNHGEYWSLGECLGTFGFSVRKTPDPNQGKKAGHPGKSKAGHPTKSKAGLPGARKTGLSGDKEGPAGRPGKKFDYKRAPEGKTVRKKSERK